MPKLKLSKEEQVGKLFRLRSGLYGLKDAAETWDKLLFDTLTECDLKEIDTAPCVFLVARQWYCALFMI